MIAPAKRSLFREEWQPGKVTGRDTYLFFLCTILFGYAFLGKGFAYIGVPPVYVGEGVLGLGCLALAASGCLTVIMASLPLLMLLALTGWAVACSLPYVTLYGIDVPRDGMVIFYGIYAFVITALIVERPARLAWLLERYRGFARLYGPVGGLLFTASTNLANLVPDSGGFILPYVRPGEAAVHMAGAIAFALVGLLRVRWYWILSVALGLALVSPSRGGTLAWLLPVTVVVVLTGHIWRFMPFLLVVVALFALSLAMQLEIPLSGGERQVSAAQMLERLGSIVDQSDDTHLDGTKQWRLRWWETISGYTFNGPFFWTGKGFGINLAVDDNFLVGERSGTLLRSPHSVHVTLLARTGVTGLTLWIGTLVCWFATIANAYLAARRRGHHQWASLFIWVGAYTAACLINASFDVALEGPMQGIWFWSLFGLGTGMVMVYRASSCAPGAASV